MSPIAWRTPPRKYGPWEYVASQVTEGLVKRGFDVTLFATKDSLTEAKLISQCTEPYEENRSIDAEVEKFLHVSQVFEQAGQFDIIHNHYDYPALTYSRLIKTPVLTTIHGKPFGEALRIYKKYNSFSYYVSISNADRHEKLDYVGTVYNGIEFDKITFISEPDDYLVTVSRMSEDKGIHEAIQIAHRTGRVLHIISGVMQDPDYFKKKVKPHIDNKTVFFHRDITNEKRNELVANAFCSLSPISFPEGFGLSIAESMASGTPVIGYNLGSVSEVVEHNVTGFVVENIDQACEAVKKIETLNRKNCRIRIEKKFSVKNMVDSYIAIYEKILTNHELS